MTETVFLNPVLLWSEAEERQTIKKVDATILAAIDESLSSFGDGVKEVVYYQLEKNYHLRKQDIPSKIEEFVTGIEGIFGLGSGLIEMKILEKLYASSKGFRYIPGGKDLVFKEYVQSYRSFLTSVTP